MLPDNSYWAILYSLRYNFIGFINMCVDLDDALTLEFLAAGGLNCLWYEMYWNTWEHIETILKIQQGEVNKLDCCLLNFLYFAH